MSQTIIGLAGFASVGKDSVADVLCDIYDFNRIAFADPLREMMEALNPIVHVGPRTGSPQSNILHYVEAVHRYGYREAKDRFPEIRRLLQKLGTEAGRDVLGDTIWADTGIKRAAGLDRVVFTDVRFDNEVDAVRNAGGVIWHIKRPGYDKPATDHVSEKLPTYLKAEHVVFNSGTLEHLAGEVGHHVEGLIQ